MKRLYLRQHQHERDPNDYTIILLCLNDSIEAVNLKLSETLQIPINLLWDITQLYYLRYYSETQSYSEVRATDDNFQTFLNTSLFDDSVNFVCGM